MTEGITVLHRWTKTYENEDAVPMVTYRCGHPSLTAQTERDVTLFRCATCIAIFASPSFNVTDSLVTTTEVELQRRLDALPSTYR